MYMKDDNGMPRVVAAITVDDCFLGGKQEDIACVIKKVDTYFRILTDNDLEGHLCVDDKFLRDDKNETYLEVTMENKLNDIIKFIMTLAISTSSIRSLATSSVAI